MSLLCADRRSVGYSLGRDALKAGRTKQQLPAFDRIPSSKWGVLPLAIKFARAGRSVSIFTENLATARHHGRVVLLVNEHSASAAEMVAAFASEYGLATLVGTKTPGRFVATSPFKVGHGYRVALPVAAYHIWKGTNLEGRGVAPDVETGLDAEGLWQGRYATPGCRISAGGALIRSRATRVGGATRTCRARTDGENSTRRRLE